VRLCEVKLQELSYRKQIARQLRRQYVEGSDSVTLKSRLRVTQGHWKRNRWILLVELFVTLNVG